MSIPSKRAEIDQQKINMTGVEYFARESMKFREWDVFTRVFDLLEKAGESVPEFAMESESPDFLTFWADSKPAAPVEITETLPPGYRRSDFWREQAKPDAPKFYSIPQSLEDPWAPLKRVISEKSEKGYAQNTWLIVYYDIGAFAFEDWSRPFHQQLMDIHALEPFEGRKYFERLLVLSADMKGLIELHPDLRAIVPCVPILV